MRSVLRYLNIEQGVTFEDVDVISLLFMRWNFGAEDRQTNQIECNVRLSIQWLGAVIRSASRVNHFRP